MSTSDTNNQNSSSESPNTPPGSKPGDSTVSTVGLRIVTESFDPDKVDASNYKKKK